jgi:mevalonate kinase
MTTNGQWISSAPANTMLIGEHSVVYGYPALVAALPPRIQIHWRIRQDMMIEIHSELGHYLAPLDTLTDHPTLRYVLAAIGSFQPQLKQGLTLNISSEFPADWGLGSSAAVLAACLIGLETITQQPCTMWQRFKQGRKIIQTIQGRGSGADLAASLLGDCVFFAPDEQRLERLNIQHPLCLVYAGYKTPTSEVLAWVAQNWQDRPEKLNQLYQTMGQTTLAAYQALKVNNWSEFYHCVDQYQQHMQQLGVSDTQLERIYHHLQPTLPAAKISGSGLGDCVLGFGHLIEPQPYPFLNTQLSNLGAVCQPLED